MPTTDPALMPETEPAFTAADLRERLAMASAIDEMKQLSEEVQGTIIFTAQETSVLIRKSEKDLQRARAKRKQALKAGETITENSLASLAPLPSEDMEQVTFYPASSITSYWARRIKAAKAESEALGVSTSTLRGFQSWMAEGSPAETWPFSIQADGRPLDMAVAIRERMLTGKAMRLNIREFGNLLADAASSSFAKKEAEELAAVAQPH